MSGKHGVSANARALSSEAGLGTSRFLSFALWFPIIFFLATRCLNALTIALASSRQIALDQSTIDGLFVHTPTPADPGYWAIITNWDGQWYESIAQDGYQTPHAGDPNAGDQLWAWAFPPLFPLLVRGAMLLTGASFPVAATALNLTLGATAMVLLFRLLDRTGGRTLATSGVALTCCFISAPLLQFAYSEALGLTLLLGTFLALQGRRYGWAIVLTILLSLTRLITPPLALVGLVLLSAFWNDRRQTPVKFRDLAGLLGLVAVSIIGIWLWSGLAAIWAPGGNGADTRTGGRPSFYLGYFSESYSGIGWTGPALVVLALIILFLISRSKWTRDWGLILQIWLWAYPLFILIATPITGGILRYLLLCPPFALLAAGSKECMPHRVRLALVSAACLLGLLLQAIWINAALVITSTPLMP